MFIALAVAAVLQRAAEIAPARVDPARDGVRQVIEELEAAELRFSYAWRAAYGRNQDARYESWGPEYGRANPKRGQPMNAYMTPRQQAVVALSNAFAFCDESARSYVWSMSAVPTTRGIASDSSNFVGCPSWNLTDTLPYDARLDVDAAVHPQYRASVRQWREQLIGLFDGAARKYPGNTWIAGQRVRLLVDQRATARAVTAARECRADAAWCASLVGYALSAHGEIAAADSAFHVATTVMSPAERCQSNDIHVLLQPEERAAYAQLSCAQRDSANNVIWWLSDPLYLDAGNERRVEHYARVVATSLHRALERDERYDWRSGTGGDALQEMFMRYGWPSYNYWPYGWVAGHLDVVRLGSHIFAHVKGGYATFEYSRGRLQTIPAWRAIANPLSAVSSDWTIADPNQPVPQVTYRDDRRSREFALLVGRVSEWWPQQHFLPRAPLAQLTDGQRAFLRRDSSVVFATAIDLDTAFGRSGTAIPGVTLFTTPHPDTVHVAGRTDAATGTPLVVYGPMDARPSLVAIEFPAANGRPGGRTRFGVAPPQTLASMQRGDQAISDIVLLRPLTGNAEYPRDPSGVLAHMATSTRVSRRAQLGLYWETYGIAPNDSVEIAVWIERHTPQGILRQFGIRLGVATDENTPVAQAWTESQIGRNAHVVPGRVPIVGRTVTLDVSRLSAGDYWLDIVVRKSGRDPIRSRRPFTVPRS